MRPHLITWRLTALVPLLLASSTLSLAADLCASTASFKAFECVRADGMIHVVGDFFAPEARNPAGLTWSVYSEKDGTLLHRETGLGDTPGLFVINGKEFRRFWGDLFGDGSRVWILRAEAQPTSAILIRRYSPTEHKFLPLQLKGEDIVATLKGPLKFEAKKGEAPVLEIPTKDEGPLRYRLSRTELVPEKP